MVDYRFVVGTCWLWLIGCANGYQKFQLEDGPTVHAFRRAYANVYVIEQYGHRILFDTGQSHTLGALLEAMEDVGLDPRTLDVVILSHGHTDHSGGAADLQKIYRRSIVAGAGDRHMFQTGKNGPLCPRPSLWFQDLADWFEQPYPAFVPDHVVEQSIDLSRWSPIQGQIWQISGHTPGSLILQVGEAVFVGDLFRGSLWGHGAMPHVYECDPVVLRGKIAEIFERLAPQATMFFPGHLGPLTRTAVQQLLLTQ